MTTNIAWKEHHREWLNEYRTLIDPINDPKKNNTIIYTMHQILKQETMII